MEEAALGIAIASIIYNIVLTMKIKKIDPIVNCTWDPKQDWTCNCKVCQHVKTLSEETIEDIIKGAIPETNG